MQDLPKYAVLVRWLREQIASGQIRRGEKLYSENELSAMFGISRQTVRQAIGILEQDKLVKRRQGSGTYVTGGAGEARSHSMTIGVITTYLAGYIFPAILMGIERVLTENGYSIQVAMTGDRVEGEARALRTMLEKGVDGIIVEPTKSGLPNPNQEIYRQIEQQKLPLVFFNANYPWSAFPHVALDDQAAGRLATEYLIRHGHRSIGGIFQSDDIQGHLRYAGYVEAMREAGLEVQDEHVLWYATEDWDDLIKDFPRVRRRSEACTAIVCYNDMLAYELVELFYRNGVSVPQDISLVGFDNSDWAARCEVPLTSVSHPKELLGESAAKSMLRLIADPAEDVTVNFLPRIVERESVRTLLE